MFAVTEYTPKDKVRSIIKDCITHIEEFLRDLPSVKQEKPLEIEKGDYIHCRKCDKLVKIDLQRLVSAEFPVIKCPHCGHGDAINFYNGEGDLERLKIIKKY